MRNVGLKLMVSIDTVEGTNMVQSSSRKSVAVLAVRTCILSLVVSSALLLTSCATMSPDARAVFYSGWGNPNSNSLIQ